MGEEVRDNPVAVWIHSLAPWQEFATMTFRPTSRGTGTGQYAATQHWRAFMDRELRGTSWFAAFEANPGMPGYHVHALLAGMQLRRTEAWRLWFQKHGRNRIEAIRSKADVLSYAAKYVIKDKRTWWDCAIFPLRDPQPAEASP